MLKKLAALVKRYGVVIFAFVGVFAACNFVLLQVNGPAVEITGKNNRVVIIGTGDDGFDMAAYCEAADRVGRIESPDLGGGYTYILQLGLSQVTWPAGGNEDNPAATLYWLEDGDQKSRPVEMTVSARECAIRRHS